MTQMSKVTKMTKMTKLTNNRKTKLNHFEMTKKESRASQNYIFKHEWNVTLWKVGDSVKRVTSAFLKDTTNKNQQINWLAVRKKNSRSKWEIQGLIFFRIFFWTVLPQLMHVVVLRVHKPLPTWKHTKNGKIRATTFHGLFKSCQKIAYQITVKKMCFFD